MKSKLVQRKSLFLILLIEIILIGCSLVRCFLPINQVIIPGSELKLIGNFQTSVHEDGSVTVESQGTTGGEIWESEEFSLSPGSYEIQLDYDTNDEENTLGFCYLASERNPAAFTDCVFTFEKTDSIQTGRTWIRTGSIVNDMKMVFTYNGNGYLEIRSITITESRVYRLVKSAAIILASIAVNFIYFVFFYRGKHALSLQQKKTAFILLATIIFASLPVFTDSLKGGQENGQDLLYHLDRILALSQELRYGQIPVRMQTEILNGYGYASSLLYGDIFLYIPAFLHMVHVPLQLAYKIYVVLINAGTCLFSYLCFKKITGVNWAGVFGACSYTLCSYRIVDVFVRAAVGEYTAMMFFPLILLGIWTLTAASSEQKLTIKDYGPLCLGLTGVIQSHLISFEMAVIFCVIFIIFAWKRIFRKNVLLAGIKTVLITVGLNLWFLIPLLEYMQQELKVSVRGTDLLQIHGATLTQIFGVFFPALGQSLTEGTQGEMPLTLGIALTGVIALYFWYRLEQSEEKEGFLFGFTRVTCVLGVLAILFSTEYFPWDSLKEISEMAGKYLCMIQFPWRYLAIASIMLSGTAAGVMALFTKRGQVIFAKGAAVLLGVLCVLSNGFFYMDYINETEDAYYYSEQDIGTSWIGAGEYLPQHAYAEDMTETEPIASQELSLLNYCRNAGVSQVWCENIGEEEGVIDFPLVYYKDYIAYSLEDGKELDLYENDHGLISVSIPVGFQGTVAVQFCSPWYWRMAEIISAISAVVLVSGWLYVRKKRGVK